MKREKEKKQQVFFSILLTAEEGRGKLIVNKEVVKVVF